MPNGTLNGNGTLRWAIATLIAVLGLFAGAVVDRLTIQNILGTLQEQSRENRLLIDEQNRILVLLEADVRRIDIGQAENRVTIDRVVKDVDWLKKH